MTQTPQPAQVLPHAAAVLLKQAAQAPIPPTDPLARVKAVEQAAARVRQQWPMYFRAEGGCTKPSL